MLGFFKKKTGKTLTLELAGLHCVSCSLLIDECAEELPGVLSCQTNYARQVATLTYDEKKFDLAKLVAALENEGYTIKKVNV